MKVLLLLNGLEGCQTGIEDGFKYILKSGKISKLDWFYFEDFAKKNSRYDSKLKMMNLAKDLEPNLIIFFHISKFPIDNLFLAELREINSKPKLVYDEGDMYGSWAKPITKQMIDVIKNADVVSIRGLGKFYDKIVKLNKNIIYTPHHNDISRFESQNIKNESRKLDLVLVGNRIKPRFLSFIRRLPGAKGRENFVRNIGSVFQKQFKLFGNGWDKFQCTQGPVDFYKQNEIYKNAKITLAYEHYPEIPYYFSNRLPMALMNGSIYVCHYHKGYENMFPNCDFIFFFKTNSEAIDIINYLLSLSNEELCLRSTHAREFALRQYHPNVIWTNFFNNVMKNVKF
jgi:hypothetical protein